MVCSSCLFWLYIISCTCLVIKRYCGNILQYFVAIIIDNIIRFNSMAHWSIFFVLQMITQTMMKAMTELEKYDLSLKINQHVRFSQL